jgi:hypothetical protein
MIWRVLTDHFEFYKNQNCFFGCKVGSAFGFSTENPDALVFKNRKGFKRKLKYLNLSGNQLRGVPKQMMKLNFEKDQFRNNFMRVAFWKDFKLEKRDDEIKEENDDGKMPRLLVISDQICPFNPSLTN